MTGPEHATRHDGPFGWAEKMDLAEATEGPETLCHWLICSPAWHPLWTQYVLVVVRLRDGIPGMDPPKRQFPGATHELIVMALNPDPDITGHKPFASGAELLGWAREHGIPYLQPVNIVEQFEASDEEMRKLASMCAWGVTAGHLEPETSNGPERIRARWKSSMVKTLAHFRGEVHAR